MHEIQDKLVVDIIFFYRQINFFNLSENKNTNTDGKRIALIV